MKIFKNLDIGCALSHIFVAGVVAVASWVLFISNPPKELIPALLVLPISGLIFLFSLFWHCKYKEEKEGGDNNV